MSSDNDSDGGVIAVATERDENSRAQSGPNRHDGRVEALTSELLRLVRTADKVSASRAALAELRQSINDPLRGAKHVTPFLGEYEQKDEAWFYLVAALFALHRDHAPGVSLGEALRRVRDKRGSDSIDGRFVALLSAPATLLPERLRSVVTLLKASEQPLDWRLLLYHVLQWEKPNKPVQHKLARDFYRKASAKDTADNNAPTVTAS